MAAKDETNLQSSDRRSQNMGWDAGDNIWGGAKSQHQHSHDRESSTLPRQAELLMNWHYCIARLPISQGSGDDAQSLEGRIHRVRAYSSVCCEAAKGTEMGSRDAAWYLENIGAGSNSTATAAVDAHHSYFWYPAHAAASCASGRQQ